MALTKAKLISDGVITTANLADNSVTAAKLNNITTDDISEGTNKFAAQSDLDKLSGIEALADVTDAANVAAAGALMSGTAALSDLVDVSSSSPVDGQVLTYDTTNGWQAEDSQGGAEYTISEISTNTSAAKDFIYVLTASLTVTLPASPTIGDKLAIVNTSGTTTPVVARNGSLIMGAAEDFTIDVNNVAIELIYTGATKGWIIIADSIYGSEAAPSGGSSIDGTGTANYVTKWSDTDTLTDSVIYDNGTNVGIGTTTTNAKLTVNGFLEVTASGNIFTAATSGIFFNGYNSYAVGIFNDNSGSLIFNTSSAQRMRITSGGDVGINTSSPAPASGRALTIYDATRANLVVNTNGNKAELFVDGSNFYLDHYPAGDIIFRNSTRTERARITSGGTLKLDAGGILQFASNTSTPAYGVAIHRPQADTLAFVTNSGERMRITSGGNVNIGGANADKKFVIEDANYSARFYGEGFNFVMGDPISGINRVIYFKNSGAGGLTVSVQGTLIKSSGSFKIDHPLKPETHYLVHSFVESPQANNIYRGKVQLVDGKATVNLDEVSTMTEGTFTALNRDIHTYTSNESDWDAVRGNVQGNMLTIECQNTESTATVSWLVIGERQDKHMFDTDWTDENGKVIVEPEKTQEDLTALNKNINS